MAESDEERAKRELREAVRRAVEGVEAPAPNSADRDAQACGSAEMTGDKSRRS